MDPHTTLATIERHYRQVLELTAAQEAVLRSGDLEALARLLSDKSRTLGEAQVLTQKLGESKMATSGEAAQEALERIAGILSDIVAAEERCTTLVPAQKPPPAPRNQAIAAYRTR